MGAAYADCPSPTFGDPEDLYISFLAANGTQAAPGTIMPSTVKEGTLAYNDTSNTMTLCNGTAWVGVGSGGGTLAALTDVNVTGAAANSVLMFDGTTWIAVPGALTQQMIPAGDGTLLGNMTASGGLAAGFDGNTAQADAAGAYSNTGPTSWIGKEFATNRAVTSWKAWGSTTAGFSNATSNGTSTWQLQYKDTACTIDTGWTAADGIVSITTNSQNIDRTGVAAGAHKCWRLKYLTGSGDARTAELQFFETVSGSSGGSGGSSNYRAVTFGYRSGAIQIFQNNGVASISRTGAGTYEITWTTPFANDDYVVTGTCNALGAGGNAFTLEGGSAGDGTSVGIYTNKASVGCRVGSTNTSTDSQTITVLAFDVTGLTGGSGSGSSSEVSFVASLAANTSIGNATWIDLPGFTQISEGGGDNFNASTGKFTAPSDGTYVFSAVAQMGTAANGGAVMVQIDGANAAGTQQVCYNISGPAVGYGVAATCTGAIYMTAGQVVEMIAWQNSGGTIIVNQARTMFSGYKVGGGSSDTLSGLSCTSGQVPQWSGTAWACGSGDPAVGFRGTKASGSLATAGFNILAGYTEVFDDGGGFDPTTGIYTAPSAGIYSFSGTVGTGQNPTNYVSFFALNGTAPWTYGTRYGATATGPFSVATATYKLNAGDTVRFGIHNELSSGTHSLVEFSGFKVSGSGGSDTLSGLSCTSGQVPQWSGTAWACGSGGSGTAGPSFFVYNSAGTQTVATNSIVPLSWNTEVYDTAGAFASNTFTPQVAGKYIISGTVFCTDSVSYCEVYVYKNGVGVSTEFVRGTAASAHVTTLVDLNGSTDYVDLRVQNGGGTTIQGGQLYTNFSGALVGGGGSGGGGGSSTPAASGRAWRTSNYTPAAIGTYYNLPLDAGNGSLAGVTHSTTTNPERLTVSAAGTYLVTYHVASTYTPANSTNYARLAVNGTAVAGSDTSLSEATNNYGGFLSGSAVVTLGANDYVTLQVMKNSGSNIFHSGALNIISVGGGSDTLSGLSCTSGQVPQWSGTAWACAAAGGAGTDVAFAARKSGNQTLTTSTHEKLTWNSTDFNTSSGFNTATGTFTAPVAGKYYVYLNVYCSSATTFCAASIRKNGIATPVLQNNGANASAVSFGLAVGILELAAGDTLEAYGYNGGGTLIAGAYTTFGGYLLGGGGSDTLSGLSCTSGQVPQWNGTTWACGSGASAGTAPGFYAYNSAGNFTVNATAGFIEIALPTVSYNVGSAYNTTTGRFTPQVAGRYIATSTMFMPSCNTSGVGVVAIYKNGTPIAYSPQVPVGAARENVSVVADMNGSTDYLSAYVYCTAGTTYNAAIGQGHFSAALLGGGGSDTLSGLSCTSGQIPQWNGTAWACGSGGSGTSVAFRVHKNGTSQTVTTNVNTLLTFSTEAFDTGNAFDTTTGRFTPQTAGKYQINLTVYCADAVNYCQAHLYKNGVLYATRFARTNSTNSAVNVSAMVDMNGTTDYITAQVVNNGGTTIGGDATGTYLEGFLLGGGGGSGGGGGGSTEVSFTARDGIANMAHATWVDLAPTQITETGGDNYSTGGKFTAPSAGTYVFSASLSPNTATGRIILFVQTDDASTAGTRVCSSWVPVVTNNSSASCTGAIYLSAGQIVEAVGYHEGGSLATLGAQRVSFSGYKISGGGSDTLSGLSCTSGQVPQWNGTSWACGTGGSSTPAPSFHVNKAGTNQTVSASESVITWPNDSTTPAFDSNNNVASNRFTPTVAGKYLITLNTYVINGTHSALIYKNSTKIASNYNPSSNQINTVTTIVEMNGSTDYIEARISAITGTVLEGLVDHTYMTGTLVGAAGGGGSDTLSGLSCTSGQVPQWNGTAWACGTGGGGSVPGSSFRGTTGAIAIGASETVVTGYTEQFDTSNNFNNSTGIFTAPSAGRYIFSVSAVNQGTATANFYTVFRVNNVTTTNASRAQAGTSQAFPVAAGSAIYNLAQNDTVSIAAYSNTTANTTFEFSGASLSGGGSGTPATPVNSVQFNDASAFGGSANMTFDKTANSNEGKLTLGSTAALTAGANVLDVVGRVTTNGLQMKLVSGAAQPSNFSSGGGASLDTSLLYMATSQLLGAQLNTNSFADSYNALSYVDVAGATALSTLPAGLLKPTDTLDANTALLLHFDGTAGSAAFPAATGQTVSVTGSVAVNNSVSKFSGSGGFNGSSSYLTVPDSADWNLGTSNFTVDWWEYRTANNAGAPVGRNPTSTYAYLIGYGGVLYMSSAGSAWDISNGRVINQTLNTWVHCAVVRSGSTFYIFKNGVQTDTWTSSASIFSPAGPLSIGYQQSNPSAFSGYLDELRFSKGIARWTSGFTPPNAAYYGVANNMTTASTVLTTSTAPSSIKVVAKVNYLDTPTLGTDLMFDVSRDSGTTWTPVTMVDKGSVGSVRTLESGFTSVTSQPAGTSIKYRVRTANNKMVEIQDVYLTWQ